MLPIKKKLRPLLPLKKSRDFDAVNRKGKSFQGHFLRVVVSPNKNKDSVSKLGITISKKIHKHAVLRNRFRRRIKELFRTVLRPHFTASEIHVIARQGSFAATAAELRDEILRLLRNFPKK